MGLYFYNRDLLGDKVMENLNQVLFERSHFPWNSSPLDFPSCLSLVFSCELCFPRFTFTHAFVSHYWKTHFSRSSLPVPVDVEQIQDVTVEEGRNVAKECNVTAGTPPLNYLWKNMKTGKVTEGKLLTIIDIRRNQSGEYRCTANNTCGNESTGMFIDVHCKNLCNVFIRLSNVYYSGVFLGSTILIQSAASLAVGFLFSVLPNLISTLILL